jgi:hypothetical protein
MHMQSIACDTGYSGTVTATCGSSGTYAFGGTCTVVRRGNHMANWNYRVAVALLHKFCKSLVMCGHLPG